MKKEITITFFCLLAIFVISVSSCKEAFEVTAVRIFPEEAEIEEGDSLQMQVAVDFNCDGVKYENRLDYSWLSSDETVASVSENGLVKGLKRGVTTVTFVCADKSVSAEIYVEKKFDDE